MIVTIDANILFKDPFLKGAGATVAKAAADQLGFQLALTEVVLAEAEGNFAGRLKDATSKTRALSRVLIELGFGAVPSAPSQPEIDEAVRKYRSTLETDFPQEMRIPFPTITLQELLQRAISKLRPFREVDKGFRDTLIWLSLLTLLKSSNENIVFITNDEGFRKDKEMNDVHPDLLNDLTQEGIELDRFLIYRSLNEFTDNFIYSKLDRLEEIRAGIESGAIELPEEVTDSVAINLWEYSIGVEFDPGEFDVWDAFAAEVDVIEDVSIDEVESATLLPGDDILLRCIWEGEITFIVHKHGYRRESVPKPFQALVEMIVKPETYVLETMDVLEFELIEPSY